MPFPGCNNWKKNNINVVKKKKKNTKSYYCQIQDKTVIPAGYDEAIV